MKKDALIFLGIIIGSVFLLLFLVSSVGKSSVGGISFQQPYFEAGDITNTQIDCSFANASTSVVGGQSGRSSFIATNVGATVIHLCRGAVACSATTSIPLLASSSAAGFRYEQTDGYVGAYVCRAETATSSLNVSYSQ